MTERLAFLDVSKISIRSMTAWRFYINRYFLLYLSLCGHRRKKDCLPMTKKVIMIPRYKLPIRQTNTSW